MTAEPLTDLELHALRHCIQVDMAPQEILHLSDVQVLARLLANLDQATAQVISMTATAVREAERMDKLAADLEACRQQARTHLAAGEKARDQFDQATHMLEQIATAPKTNNEDLQSLAKIFLADLEQRRS
jgi:hypothetical protein